MVSTSPGQVALRRAVRVNEDRRLDAGVPLPPPTTELTPTIWPSTYVSSCCGRLGWHDFRRQSQPRRSGLWHSLRSPYSGRPGNRNFHLRHFARRVGAQRSKRTYKPVRLARDSGRDLHAAPSGTAATPGENALYGHCSGHSHADMLVCAATSRAAE